MSRFTSNPSNEHQPSRYEAAVNNLYDYLMDMDIEVLCDELVVTKEDIIDRFKDKVYELYLHVDRGIEQTLADLYEEEEEDLWRGTNRDTTLEHLLDEEEEKQRHR